MSTVTDTMNEQERQPSGIKLTEQQLRARRARSIAIALALGAFVIVIFAVTMVKLGSGALSGDDYMRPVQTTK
jgi:CHASE3 domain sensor protein